MTADPNPYRPPASDNRNTDSAAAPQGIFASGAFVVGVVQAALWIALGVTGLRVVRAFEKIFHDFGAELPGMTIVLIQFTQFLRHFWYLAFLLVVSWPLVNWSIVSALSPRPEVVIPRRLWYFVTWAALILTLQFAVVALFRPLIILITKLSR
jgi:type II secretory pathway component PulF